MLKKDVLALCLLHLLTQGDRYGYDLIRQLRDGFSDTQESNLYALLRTLCREGYTQQYQGEVSEGPVRKYYRLTPEGQARHDELLESWRALLGAVTALGVE